MALIREPVGYGDLRDRRVRPGQLAARLLDPDPPDVLADRAAVVLTERTRQMGRMHAHRVGDLRQAPRRDRTVVQQLADAREPSRYAVALASVASEDGDQLADQTLDRECRGELSTVGFRVDLAHQALDASTADLFDAFEDRRAHPETLQMRGPDLDVHDPDSGGAGAHGMTRTRRVDDDGRFAVLAIARAVELRARSGEEQVYAGVLVLVAGLAAAGTKRAFGHIDPLE